MILHLLLQVLLLSWPRVVLAQPSVLTKPNCQSKCGNVSIPFPFGIGSGCYMDDWFAMDCFSGNKPFLISVFLEVLDISLNGTMRVKLPVFGSCSDPKTMSVGYLKKSPFLFSQKRNIFTGLGCNNLAILQSISDDSIIGGCFSLCDGKTTKKENSCYGRKCCQTRIPPFLQVFKTSVSTIGMGRGDQEPERCKHAFLVEQGWFESNLTSPQDVMAMSQVPVVLDWGVFSHTFKPTSGCRVFANISYATKLNSSTEVNYTATKGSFATNKTSYSTTRHPVYQCSCEPGYGGNPYLLQGCRDIDECQPNSGICGNMICINSLGGYSCVSTIDRIKKLVIEPLEPPSTLIRNVFKDKLLLLFNIIGVGIGTCLVFLFLLLGGWRLRFVIKRRINRKKMFFERNGGLLLNQRLITSNGIVERCKLFNSNELKKATDNFNVNRVLGQGGQGTVYKGMLVDGSIVAIKKSKVVDEEKIEEFINEVVILSQINHRNVVKLLGCCLETEVPLLVYEFIPNGTLSHYLYNQDEELHLTWDMRLRIASEAAGALSYLHSAASLPIYHRDIKSTNILLDDKYRPKVADFGISRSMAIDQTHVTTKVQGTLGYLDPEFFRSSQFTDKSDVYSFGVVLVELLTRQKPICSTRSEGQRNLATYFTSSMTQNCMNDILDEQIMETGNREEIIAAANVAKRCLNENGKKRPTMREVAAELERIRASRKDSNVKLNYEKAESLKPEVIELWDIAYTPRSSAMSTPDFGNIGASIHVEPLLTSRW